MAEPLIKGIVDRYIKIAEDLVETRESISKICDGFKLDGHYCPLIETDEDHERWEDYVGVEYHAEDLKRELRGITLAIATQDVEMFRWFLGGSIKETPIDRDVVNAVLKIVPVDSIGYNNLKRYASLMKSSDKLLRKMLKYAESSLIRLIPDLKYDIDSIKKLSDWTYESNYKELHTRFEKYKRMIESPINYYYCGTIVGVGGDSLIYLTDLEESWGRNVEANLKLVNDLSLNGVRILYNEINTVEMIRSARNDIHSKKVDEVNLLFYFPQKTIAKIKISRGLADKFESYECDLYSTIDSIEHTQNIEKDVLERLDKAGFKRIIKNKILEKEVTSEHIRQILSQETREPSYNLVRRPEILKEISQNLPKEDVKTLPPHQIREECMFELFHDFHNGLIQQKL